MSTLKWERSSGRELRTAYRDFVDVFFDAAAAKELRFRCILVPHLEDPSQAAGGIELGFYKTYHLLLCHRLLPGLKYHVTLDRRSNQERDREEQLLDHVNETMLRRHSDDPPEIVSCKPGKCSTEDLLQLTDVLLGALAWSWNGGASGSVAKEQLAAHIAARLGWPSLARETARDARPFDVWRYRRNA